MTDQPALTVWVDRHGRPCDSMRHDARKLEVVPVDKVEQLVAERDRLERELADAREALLTAVAYMPERCEPDCEGPDGPGTCVRLKAWAQIDRALEQQDGTSTPTERTP